ncbi:MAG: BspA family leucine-rich repeat surface protein, partial [Lachnospiraceae bacterium]|nr:BspA family leucine-rich repeat surface protein [Lachnospiraceae bacterium]
MKTKQGKRIIALSLALLLATGEFLQMGSSPVFAEGTEAATVTGEQEVAGSENFSEDTAAQTAAQTMAAREEENLTSETATPEEESLIAETESQDGYVTTKMEDWEYQKNLMFGTTGVIYLKKYTGPDKKILIPAKMQEGDNTYTVALQGMGANPFELEWDVALQQYVPVYEDGEGPNAANLLTDIKLADGITLFPENGGAFSYCNSLVNLDISGGSVTGLKPMQGMFKKCTSLRNLKLCNNLDTSYAENMSEMFSDCWCLTIPDLSGFNTANVTDMHSMFENCRCLQNLDISGFDTQKVKDMSGMFRGCTALASLKLTGSNAKFVTSAVTDMSLMFAGCSRLDTLDINSFDTSKVTSMNCMFQGCRSIKTLDLTGFQTNKVNDMNCMFAGMSSLETIYAGTGFDTGNVTNDISMFEGDTKLVGGSGTVYSSDHMDKEYARGDVIDPGDHSNDQPGYFTVAAVSTINDWNYTEDGGTVILDGYANTYQRNIIIPATMMVGSKKCNVVLRKIRNSKNDEADVSYLKSIVIADGVKAAADASGMFEGCSGLNRLDITGLDTGQTENMSRMFSGVQGVDKLDLSK